MATIRKRGNKYQAIVRMKKINRSKVFHTRSEATRWANQLEDDITSGNSITLGKTVQDAFDKYEREVSPKHKGRKWESIRFKKLKREKWTYNQIIDVNGQMLQYWIDTSPLQAGSIIRDISLVRSVFEKARKNWKWIPRNPFSDVDAPKKPVPRDRRIHNNEVKLVLAALDYKPDTTYRGCAWECAVAFQFAIETAMRRGEIWSMQWHNVDVERRFVYLPDTKNGLPRSVPLSTKAIDLLKLIGLSESGSVFKTNIASAETIFRSKIKKAGIEDLRFHDTRHEAITRLTKKLDVFELSRAVGHKDLNSLLIYYNATPEEIAKRLD